MWTGLLFRLAVAVGLVVGVGVMTRPVVAESPTAADEAKESGAHAAKGGEHAEKDKTAFMGIKRYDLGIYTLIVFGALFFVLGKYAWKPIMEGLQKREDAIVKARTDAETARGEAQKLLDEVKAQRLKANDEIAAILMEARKDADAYREAEKARTAADIQADRERLKREIETARDQALQDIWDKTVQMATLVSSKALGRAVTADDHRRLIDESLAELGQRINRDRV